MKTNILLILLALITSARAQSPAPAASTTPPPCVAPEFRQFDFWLGKWKVMNPQNGKEAGTSEITRVADGCAVREQWKGAGGTNGTSINYFDPAEREWHQDWVGSDGTILHLRGKFDGGAMVLSGATKSAKGTTLNRITWSQLEGGKVKQEWTSSSDDGRTWQVSFVGIYEKQP